jgi:hypothetical protein
MHADSGDLIALMPFARHLGLVLDEATADRVVAQTTQVQAVRPPR